MDKDLKANPPLAIQTDKTDKEFNKATKAGVFKELHKRGFIDDSQLAALIKLAAE